MVLETKLVNLKGKMLQKVPFVCASLISSPLLKTWEDLGFWKQVLHLPRTLSCFFPRPPDGITRPFAPDVFFPKMFLLRLRVGLGRYYLKSSGEEKKIFCCHRLGFKNPEQKFHYGGPNYLFFFKWTFFSIGTS